MLSLFIIGGIFYEDSVDIHALYAANARNKYIDKMAFWCSSSLGAYFIGFFTMRPSEYVVLAGMLIVFFINVGKKPRGNAFRFLFSQWSRFLKVPTSSSDSPQQSHQKE